MCKSEEEQTLVEKQIIEVYQNVILFDEMGLYPKIQNSLCFNSATAFRCKHMQDA